MCFNPGGSNFLPVPDVLPNFGRCTNSGKVEKREKSVSANHSHHLRQTTADLRKIIARIELPKTNTGHRLVWAQGAV